MKSGLSCPLFSFFFLNDRWGLDSPAIQESQTFASLQSCQLIRINIPLEVTYVANERRDLNSKCLGAAFTLY